MNNIKNITETLLWIGADDRRLALFEHVYPIPNGISYNSYLLLDQKIAVLDCVDQSSSETFFDNLSYGLNGRNPDFLIIHHMEPDHAATIGDFVRRYPDAKLVCNQKSLSLLKQFFDFDADSRALLVKEGDTLSLGRHTLTFYMAPMVHWPEVMISYDSTDKILFSADAFGHFGALNGALYADQVDFLKDFMDEARRYYANIVGKYGFQVQSLLNKAKLLDIRMICPLHGYIWRKDFSVFIDKYDLWSRYCPEENGVLIAVGSIYGHTENAAEILAGKLSERNIKTVIRDVSTIHFSTILADIFRYSNIVFACATYNNGIFTNMETLVADIVAHGLGNRVISYIQNGSWAPVSAKLIAEQMAKLKNMTTAEPVITIRSALKQEQLADLDALAGAIAVSMTNK
jgi:flavorubredoxin